MAYIQINLSERYRIVAMLEIGSSVHAMAAALKRSPTTMRAELRRGKPLHHEAYCAQTVHALAQQRKANNAKRLDDKVWSPV